MLSRNDVCKKGTFPSNIFLSNAKQMRPFVLLDNKMNKASHQTLIVRIDTTIVLIKKALLFMLLHLAQAVEELRILRAVIFCKGTRLWSKRNSEEPKCS